MKTLAITSALILTTAFSAQARVPSADQLETIVKCINTPARPDYSKEVVIRTGGIAGITTASVYTFYMGRETSSKDIIVQPVVTRRIGAPIDYVGEGFKLSVNHTVQPDEQGRVVGRLTENGHSELMKCK